MSTSPLPIDKVLTDQQLLGAGLGPIDSWRVWLAILKAAFALALTDEELKTFASVAGGRVPPLKRIRELFVVAGRRSGKSRMAGALACYFALFVQYKLAAGERGVVLVLSNTIDQSKVVFGYVLGFLRSSDILRREIIGVTSNEIRLRNGITIAIHASSFRSVRGPAICAAILDEVAYFRDLESAIPDTEIYTALLPALLTTNGMLIGISSPYRKIGLLATKHKQCFGVDNPDILVVQGSSETFNNTLDVAAIARQTEADPIAALSEWGGLFRQDVQGFLDEELIGAAIDRARPLELPPRPDLYYRAHVDVSGGAASGDAYTLCIAHRQDGLYVVDLIRGQSGPFEPVELTKDYAKLCREYRIQTVTGDRYGAAWVSSAWANTGISYVPSELTASELYLETLPLWTRALVSIPDHPVLVRELRLLERSPARLKREQVTHPKGCHDDHANAVCGALASLATYLGASAYADSLSRAIDDDNSPSSSATLAWEERQRQARHDELMRIYGKPPPLAPPLDLVPENLRASFQRAQQSAWEAQRRNRGGSNGQI